MCLYGPLHHLFQRGNAYARRRRERECEIEEDRRDRQKEKDEIEALRLQVMEKQVLAREVRVYRDTVRAKIKCLKGK